MDRKKLIKTATNYYCISGYDNIQTKYIRHKNMLQLCIREVKNKYYQNLLEYTRLIMIIMMLSPLIIIMMIMKLMMMMMMMMMIIIIIVIIIIMIMNNNNDNDDNDDNNDTSSHCVLCTHKHRILGWNHFRNLTSQILPHYLQTHRACRTTNTLQYFLCPPKLYTIV